MSKRGNIDLLLKKEYTEEAITFGDRCGVKCHHKFDDGSECAGRCDRIGDPDNNPHDGSHSCSHGRSHNSW